MTGRSTTAAICGAIATTALASVGPCVLRPGHRGRVHRDARGWQWSAKADDSRRETAATTPAVLDVVGDTDPDAALTGTEELRREAVRRISVAFDVPQSLLLDRGEPTDEQLVVCDTARGESPFGWSEPGDDEPKEPRP